VQDSRVTLSERAGANTSSASTACRSTASYCAVDATFGHRLLRRLLCLSLPAVLAPLRRVGAGDPEDRHSRRRCAVRPLWIGVGRGAGVGGDGRGHRAHHREENYEAAAAGVGICLLAGGSVRIFVRLG
jgi:hypothetical protein